MDHRTPRGPYQTIIAEAVPHGDWSLIEDVLRDIHGSGYSRAIDHVPRAILLRDARAVHVELMGMA